MQTITAAELLPLLVAFGVPAKMCYLFDTVYVLPSDAVVAEVLRMDQTDKDVYTPEINDCENFAIRTMAAMSGKCFGLAVVALKSGGLHAINIYVNEERQVQCIEPQTDQPTCDYEQIMGVLIG